MTAHSLAVKRLEARTAFRPPSDVTVAEIIDSYRQRGVATTKAIREAGSLAVACAHPVAASKELDLRWVLVHLVEETARHAGHADATRELLDGATGL